MQVWYKHTYTVNVTQKRGQVALGRPYWPWLAVSMAPHRRASGTWTASFCVLLRSKPMGLAFV